MEPRNVPEKLRNVSERLRNVAEELGNVAGKLGNPGEPQNNWGEFRKNSGELSVRVSTSHRNVLDRLRKAGGSYEIAPGHAGNGEEELRASGNSSAKAVETSQVLNDTLGRPRGPRDVSAGGHAVAEGNA